MVDGQPYNPSREEPPNSVHNGRAYCSQVNTLDNQGPLNWTVDNLKFIYLNVCGITSKLLNPDFATLIKRYDILIFNETKTDHLDT